MAEVIISGGAGGGAGSDDCTAVASNVLAGKTAIVNNGTDEPTSGTLPLSAVLSTNGGSILIYDGSVS